MNSRISFIFFSVKSLHEYLALPSSISYRVGFVTGPPISFLNFLTVYTALFPDVLYVLYIRGVQRLSTLISKSTLEFSFRPVVLGSEYNA